MQRKSVCAGLVLLACLCASRTGLAATVVSGDIPNDVSATFTTADTHLTLHGYSDSASTVSANLFTAGASTWFGVGANNALNGTETMTLQLAPGYGLTGFGDIWTRAVISISGFVSDPGLNVGANAGVLGSSYSSGKLELNLNWNGGGARNFTLSDAAASAGQLLTISLDFATAPQWAITHLDYAAVPEPATLSLVLLGGLAVVLVKRRARH